MPAQVDTALFAAAQNAARIAREERVQGRQHGDRLAAKATEKVAAKLAARQAEEDRLESKIAAAVSADSTTSGCSTTDAEFDAALARAESSNKKARGIDPAAAPWQAGNLFSMPSLLSTPQGAPMSEQGP